MLQCFVRGDNDEVFLSHSNQQLHSGPVAGLFQYFTQMPADIGLGTAEHGCRIFVAGALHQGTEDIQLRVCQLITGRQTL